jgi:hypothetical protein
LALVSFGCVFTIPQKVDPPSVTVAAFPVTLKFADEASEAVMTFVLDVVKAARSIKQEHLRANQEPESERVVPFSFQISVDCCLFSDLVFVRCLDEDTFNTLEQFKSMVSCIAFCCLCCDIATP